MYRNLSLILDPVDPKLVSSFLFVYVFICGFVRVPALVTRFVHSLRAFLFRVANEIAVRVPTDLFSHSDGNPSNSNGRRVVDYVVNVKYGHQVEAVEELPDHEKFTKRRVTSNDFVCED